MGGNIQCNVASGTEQLTVERCREAYEGNSIKCFYNALNFLVDKRPDQVLLAGLQEIKHSNGYRCPNRFNIESDPITQKTLKDNGYSLYIPKDDTGATGILIHEDMGRYLPISFSKNQIKYGKRYLRGIACIYLPEYDILFLNLWIAHLSSVQGADYVKLFDNINSLLEKEQVKYPYNNNTRVILTMDSNDGHKVLKKELTKIKLLGKSIYDSSIGDLDTCCEDRWNPASLYVQGGEVTWPGDYIFDTYQSPEGTTYIPDLYNAAATCARPWDPVKEMARGHEGSEIYCLVDKHTQLMSDHLPVFYNTFFPTKGPQLKTMGNSHDGQHSNDPDSIKPSHYDIEEDIHSGTSVKLEIAVIAPGAGLRRNWKSYSLLSNTKNIELIQIGDTRSKFDHDWKDFVYPDKKDFYDNVSPDQCKDTLIGLASRFKGINPDVILCGSRGGQCILRKVWETYYQKPSVIINAGILMENVSYKVEMGKIPYCVFILPAFDFFWKPLKSNPINYLSAVKQRFKNSFIKLTSKGSRGIVVFLKEEGHMPSGIGEGQDGKNYTINYRKSWSQLYADILLASAKFAYIGEEMYKTRRLVPWFDLDPNAGNPTTEEISNQINRTFGQVLENGNGLIEVYPIENL